MSNGVVVSQPLQAGNPSVLLPAPDNNFPPELGVLERNWVYKIQDNRRAGCRSCSTVYDISDGREVIMSGKRQCEAKFCVGWDYLPMVITDVVSTKPVIEILDPKEFIRSVGISSPPGNYVGMVAREGLMKNYCDINDVMSGRVFVCKDKPRTSYWKQGYPITDATTGVEVAMVDASYRILTVTDPSVNPFQKALFLGLLMLQDTINEELARNEGR